MTRRWVYITPLLIALGMGAILFTAIGKDPTKLETARLNDPFPAFNLPSLKDASKFISEKDLKGKVILVNAWATWCPSCRAEHGFLLNLSKQGVPIVGLNYKDDRADALEWLSTLGNPYTYNIYDSQGTLGFDLGVYGAPETYVLDQEGFVRYRRVGVVNEKVWQDTLLPLMNKLKSMKAGGDNKPIKNAESQGL